MNTIFKLSLAVLIATALVSFSVLMYLVFADAPAYIKYMIAKDSSLVIIPLSFLSLMFTTFTFSKGDSML